MFSTTLKTGYVAHTASYSIATEFFQGLKWPGREADLSPPPSAEINNERSCTTTPFHAFLAWTGKTLPLSFLNERLAPWLVQ
jgi:hypothetical protein